MTIQELKNTLTQVEQLVFRMEDGNKIPSHFHITEVGQIEKRFIDCGGTVRHEKKASTRAGQTSEDNRVIRTKNCIGECRNRGRIPRSKHQQICTSI